MINEATVTYQEKILTDDEFFASLIEDIYAAQQSIDMEMYIFENDTVGKQVADALCGAVKRGVRIRVLVDGIGAVTWGHEITQKMEKSGVQTRVFHPVPFISWNWFKAANAPKTFLQKFIYLLLRINVRNHRKTCIIDSKIAYVGSANITGFSKTNGSEKPWHDTTVRVSGTDLTELQYAFNRAWDKPHTPKRKHPYKNGDGIFRLNYSLTLRKQLHKSLIKKIWLSKHKIWVTNAYFVPDAMLLRVLRKAAKRGVDVTILLPSVSDVIGMRLVAKTFYQVLFEAGVKIYEYMPDVILHSKILIIDDWYSVGSSNLNYRSFHHDLEVDVRIHSKSAQRILEEQFVNDLKHSRKVSKAEIIKQPVLERLLGRMLLFFRYWM